MTRRDFIIKWLFYGAGLLPVWFFEQAVFNRFQVFGASPMLLPLAAAAVAVLEGPAAGDGFGLAVGMLCDAVYYGVPGGMTLGLAVTGMAAGVAAQYVLKKSFVGCLICSAVTLVLIDGARAALYAFQGAPLWALLRVAVPEILWSLAFAGPVYLLFRAIHRRVQVSTLF